jgi:biotin carboxylase
MVDTCGRQIVGDGFSVNGKLIFSYFADHHFDERCRNPFVPVSGSFPCSLSPEMLRRVNEEIQRLLLLLDMRTAAYNFEVRIDHDQNIYLMEAAPRNGGNFIPEVIRYSCGLDLIEYSVRGAMGENIAVESLREPQGFYSYYVVHSIRDGVLDHVEINPEVRRKHVIEEHILSRPGENVYAFTGANKGIETLLMKFENMDQMQYMTEHSEEWVNMVLRDE